MDLEALRHGNFASLGEAIGDWSKVVKNLTTLKNDARDDLKGKADKADWAGLNATVSREFITKTAGEFADAVTQATTIRDILRDTRDELVEYRGELTRALDRGWEKRLSAVGTQGGGFKVFVNAHPEPANSKQAVDALRDELQGILTKATTSDTTAAQVLRALSKQAEHGFSDASYKDRGSAADALRNADDMARIAKKDPKDLTAEDFDKLNSGMKKYRDDPLFSEQFATRMGAKGTLEFWAGINSPHENPELAHSRHDKFSELQKSLSLTLANATQSDSPAMQRWEKDMVGLGNEFVQKDNPRAMGFQVMSNLMRWGDYDDKFLKSYGTELIKTEKQRTSNGRDMSLAWRSFPGDPLLNRTGTDSGSDPMTGYMKALANSPDAATSFFNDTFVTKDEDHEFTEDTDGDGNKGKAELSNFDYLFEERDWPKDVDNKGEDSITGRNSMAWALEAATTGHPAGEQPTKDLAPHNEGQTKLMESLVTSISDDNERLTKNGFMSDSIGQIAAEYLPDINRAMANDASGEIDKLFPISGSEAELNHKDVNRFLLTVGQNPEGYANVEIGQKSYMANLMDYHLDPKLPEGQRYSVDDPQLVIEEIAHASGEVSGTLAIGRQEEVAGEADEKDKEYEHALGQKKGGISGAIGIGIGVGTSFVASPVVGVVVGGAASTVSGMVLESVFKDYEAENKDNAGQVMGEYWESGLENNIRHSQHAAELAAKAHEASGDVEKWARIGSRDGYLAAGTNTGHMSPDLKTDI